MRIQYEACTVQLVIEALDSIMCDVVKIRLKRRNATKSGKGNKLLNSKSAVKLPILNQGIPNVRWRLTFI